MGLFNWPSKRKTAQEVAPATAVGFHFAPSVVMASDSPAVVIINRTLVRALLRYVTCLSAVRQRPRPRPMICCSSST